MRSLAVFLRCVTICSAQSSSALTGTWIGTFNGQPPDGNNESVTRFRLTMRIAGKSVAGTLTVLDEKEDGPGLHYRVALG